MNKAILGAALFGFSACATFGGGTATTGAKAPDLVRPEGGFLVGLTSSSANPQPQADAFAQFVQNSTGQPARGVFFPDYDGLANAVAEGKVDVAFMSPLAFVRATEQA